MKHSDNRSAADVAVISLSGRLLSLLGRTMYTAMYGMANPLLNVFNYALNVPNVLFGVVGTALNTVMIPVYSSLLAEERREEAKKFIDNIISISMVLIGALVALGILAAPIISDLLPIADEHSSYFTFALRFLMPVMIFFGFSSIFQGLLQANGVFRLPALVSAPGGIIMIIYLLFFGDRFGVEGLVFATALGLLMQPLIMIPAMYKLGYRYKFSFDLKNPHIRRAAKLSVPVLISVSSYQINFLFNNTFALGFGTVVIMEYSQQLVQVFMLTMVYAIASVYFPKLSALWAVADAKGYIDNLRNALLYTMFVVLPAALGFFILRYEIMDFLLNWREPEYGTTDIVLAGNLLGIYSIGIIAISMKEAMDRAFYSRQDSKTPAFFGFSIMVLNISTTLILLRFSNLGLYSMPVAYCVSAFIGSGGLCIRLNRRVGFINRSFVLNIVKVLFAVAVMVMAAGFARNLELSQIGLVNLLIPVFCGAAAYLAAAFVLRIPLVLAFLKKESN